ncbi:hypothetical protein ACP4OV_014341 [Aristida adscensionis]
MWRRLQLQVSNRGIRLELTHVDARGDHTLPEADRVRRTAERGHRRVNGLLAAVAPSPATLLSDEQDTAAATATVHASTATYLVDLAIGMPPLRLTAPTPMYKPARSATYANVSCGARLCEAVPSPRSRCSAAPEIGCACYFSNGDGSSTDGVLASDTFTLGSGTAVQGVAFGCGTDNLGGTDNSSGLVGMGWGMGSRSHPTLSHNQIHPKYSYCFTPFNDMMTASPLFLGSLPSLSPAANSTVFMPSPVVPWRSSYYYLSLEGITVGDTLLPIDPAVFQLTASGRGALIIDSGTTFTALEERTFVVLVPAVAARVTQPWPLACT